MIGGGERFGVRGLPASTSGIFYFSIGRRTGIMHWCYACVMLVCVLHFMLLPHLSLL